MYDAEWEVKGEGKANLVFAYTGRSAHLAGKVLRVRKRRVYSGGNSRLPLERAVWDEVLGPDPECWDLLYIERCIKPLMGAHLIPEQVLHPFHSRHIQPLPTSNHLALLIVNCIQLLAAEPG
jgi:hypothetical protein